MKTLKGIDILRTLALLILLTACEKETEPRRAAQSTLYLNCVTQANSISRSATDFETYVEQVMALVFEFKGGEELFAYQAEASLEEAKPATGSYTVAVKLKESQATEPYRVVVLANYSLERSLEEWIGKPKNTLLKQLRFDASVSDKGDYTWHPSVMESIPMWGETTIQTSRSSTDLEQIKLLRALARVDIGFNFNVDEAGRETHSPVDPNYPNEPGNLKLARVHIFKSMNEGLVAPFTENLDANNEPFAPSIAYPEGEIPASSYNPPIDYILPNPQEDSPFKKEIYLTDSYGGRIADIHSTLTIVLGFLHPSYGEGVVRYFRADVINEGEEKTQAALRGYRYILNITHIYGKGADTPQEAFNKTTTRQTANSCYISIKKV